MARNLKEALERNRRAADALERALRECLNGLRAAPDASEARLSVIEGGRPSRPRAAVPARRRGRARQE